MVRRFIILALGISPPGSMGGNSKIALELIRWLARDRPVEVITSSDKLATFDHNIDRHEAIRIHSVAPFKGNRFLCPVQESLYYTRKVKSILQEVRADEQDALYSCSDFLLDVLPAFLLKPVFRFKWIPTLFLFVPFVFENLIRRYRFPVLKYLVYFFYQRTIFQLIKRRGDLFVITNDCDRARFPAKLQHRVFAFYGGVNTEQIEAVQSTQEALATPGLVVFCGRLHPQKGIHAFLEVWQRVLSVLPDARLAVIGNGAPEYEVRLRRKAQRLGIADRVEWLGYVNNEEKYRIYLSARVFVHPTIYDNNGMVAAEALCSGLPVVLYDLPALRQVYTSGCVKVGMGDKRAFAAEVSRLLQDASHHESVRPTSEEIIELRRFWAWESRVALFASHVLAPEEGDRSKKVGTSGGPVS